MMLKCPHGSEGPPTVTIAGNGCGVVPRETLAKGFSRITGGGVETRPYSFPCAGDIGPEQNKEKRCDVGNYGG